MRLPTAPPKISPSDVRPMTPPSGTTRTASRASTTSAITDSSATTHRHAVGMPPSIPNASPGFITSVRLARSSTTRTGAPGTSICRAICLVICSSTTMVPAITSTAVIAGG